MTAARAPQASSTGPAPSVRRGLSRGMVRLGLGLTAVIVAGGGAAWFCLAPAKPVAAEKLHAALHLLHEQDHATARQLAQTLRDRNRRDPQFAGGPEFILGLAALHDAEHSDSPDAAVEQFAAAANWLREAEQFGVADAHRAEWSFALGKALAGSNDYDAARPYLEEAADHGDAQHHVPAVLLLATVSLDAELRTPERLEHALLLVEAAEQHVPPTDDRHAAIQLLHGELLVELNRTADALALAERLSHHQEHTVTAQLLAGHAQLAQKRFDDVLRLLAPLAQQNGLDAKQARRAAFLLGWAAELRAEELAGHAAPANGMTPQANEYRQRAQDFYQKVIDRFAQSEEGLAAHVFSGRLQQEASAHEKAIQLFGAALKMVPAPKKYHNRFLSREDFRVRMLAAWNGWNQTARFGEAISLAQLMTPLFPPAQAEELAAKSRQRWAESVAAELDRSTATVRQQRTPELRRLWCDSAAAFARLARLGGSTFDRNAALWSSAEHYLRGHDFAAALVEIDTLLQDPPEYLRPAALLRRGEIALNLDRIDEAIGNLQAGIEASPTSPAAFVAQYLIGVCLLEQGDAAGAQAAWNKLLTASALTPDAVEWRDALLATARLQCELAAVEQRVAARRETSPADADAARRKAQELSAVATRNLEEFLARYPAAPQQYEAQYYLSKALQQQADWHQHQIEQAETDNIRQQARRRRDAALERALDQLEQLRDRLTALAREDRLDDAARELLVNVWFDYPSTCFRLGRYDDAIAAYTAAANQFPTDARVMTAYLQMTQAYSITGRSLEARAMLEQAQVILDQQQIPDTAFAAPTTSLTRADWHDWLDRARQVQR